MKILHVIDSMNLYQGGPSVSVPSLSQAQAALGHQVTIVCRDYAYLGPMVKAEGVEVRSIPSSRWTKGQGGWGCAFRRLVEQEAEKADVVHNHGLWLAANYYARRAAVKAGKPLVISPRGMLEDWSLGRSKMRKRVAWMLFERENLRSAKLFHATSVSEAESIKDAFQFKFKLKFKRAYGLQAADYRDDPSSISDLPSAGMPRIVVAPNGVEIPQRIPKREVVETRFPELKGRRWVLFMSRIHPKKGVDLLLQAWEQLDSDSFRIGDWGFGIEGKDKVESGKRKAEKSNRPLMLVLAGADLVGYGEEVKRMIREKGLEGAVVMTGHVDGEVREALLGHAEFMVLPSHSENFGLVVAESLAAGRPVVTTNKTPWGSELAQGDRRKEIADRGSMNLELRGCGVICEVTDLKRGLEKMLGFSDKEREEMGARGRQWMKEEFSWEAGAERLIAGYREILKPS